MKRSNQSGFTLIELMVVVAIIGILAAIAIPQFVTYRQKAFDSAATSDLRTLMLAEAAYFVEPQTYLAAAPAIGPGTVPLLPGSAVSKNVGYRINSPVPTLGYAIITGHSRGSRVFAGDHTSALYWRLPGGGLPPSADAMADATAPPLPIAWGSRL